MKNQNQTSKKNSSPVIEKSQPNVPRKPAAGEKSEQDYNKLGAKKTMQPAEKAKTNKGATKH